MIGCFRVTDCGILCFERIMLLPPALLCLELLVWMIQSFWLLPPMFEFPLTAFFSCRIQKSFAISSVVSCGRPRSFEIDLMDAAGSRRCMVPFSRIMNNHHLYHQRSASAVLFGASRDEKAHTPRFPEGRFGSLVPPRMHVSSRAVRLTRSKIQLESCQSNNRGAVILHGSWHPQTHNIWSWRGNNTCRDRETTMTIPHGTTIVLPKQPPETAVEPQDEEASMDSRPPVLVPATPLSPLGSTEPSLFQARGIPVVAHEDETITTTTTDQNNRNDPVISNAIQLPLPQSSSPPDTMEDSLTTTRLPVAPSLTTKMNRGGGEQQKVAAAVAVGTAATAGIVLATSTGNQNHTNKGTTTNSATPKHCMDECCCWTTMACCLACDESCCESMGECCCTALGGLCWCLCQCLAGMCE